MNAARRPRIAVAKDMRLSICEIPVSVEHFRTTIVATHVFIIR